MSAPGRCCGGFSSTHRHASHRDSGKPEFDTEAIAQGQAPSRRMLMTGRGPIPGDIAAWLDAEAGAEVVIRKRLQLLDDVPAVISTSYYPLRVADGTRLESSEALPEGPDNLVRDLDIRVINAATGELLRKLILDPSRNYQPTGRQSRTPRQPRHPEP